MRDPNDYGTRFPKEKIIGCMTIDSTTQDLYLDTVRKELPPTTNNHNDSQQAAGNLSNCTLRKNSMNIFGHGIHGRLITGNGRNATDRNKYMDIANIDVWGDDFEKLKVEVDYLYLFSCHTGAGEKGADFLFTLARIINAPVAAPTDYFYCEPNFFSLHENSTWQVAKATSRPSPIMSPPALQSLRFVRRVSLYRNNTLLQVSVEKVTSIEVEIKSNPLTYAQLSQSDKRNFLSMVDLASPIKLPGIPAAVVTGTFLITIDEDNNPVQKKFVVLNDRLVQDTEHPLIAYNCNPAILNYFV
jgi:hypothetical protein